MLKFLFRLKTIGCVILVTLVMGINIYCGFIDLDIGVRPLNTEVNPSPITDLVAVSGGEGEIDLMWTSPETWLNIKVRDYYIRWSTISVTDFPFLGDTTSWWNAANGQDLYNWYNNPGEKIIWTVKNLSSGVTYYFSIKSVDEYGNISTFDTKTLNLNQAFSFAGLPVPIPERVIKITHPRTQITLFDPTTNYRIDLSIETQIETTFYLRINFDAQNNAEKTDKQKIVLANQALNSSLNLLDFELVGFKLRRTSYTYMTDEEIISLVKEVKFEIYYNDSNNDGILDGTVPEINENSLRLYYLDELINRWVLSQGSQHTINLNSNILTSVFSHFSVFSLIGGSMVYNLNNILVFPNPCKPQSGTIYDSDYIVFKRLPDESTIKIFTISGEFVVSFKYPDEKNNTNNIYRWDMRNKDGKEVSSGVYIYVVEDKDGNVKKGKFSIIR